MNVFLTAEWRNLINLTYEIDPDLLKDYLPDNIEPDILPNGKAHVSLVAFDFLDTRVKGLKIPFHINFPEINLRCYVKYKGQIGVVFIKEFVPKHCIALVANKIYNEPYFSIPMKSTLQFFNDEKMTSRHEFSVSGIPYYIEATTEMIAIEHEKTSFEHYFKEHSWGFGKSHSGKTLCYFVDHSVWRTYPLLDYKLNIDFAAIYGNKWALLNEVEPTYKMMAEGSNVKVFNAITLQEMEKISFNKEEK